MKKFAAFFIAALLCASLFSGCGSDSSSGSSAATATTAPSQAAPSQAAPSTAPSPSPSEENPLDAIVGKYVGTFSMSNGKEKGVTFDIRKESDGSYSATENTYALQKYADLKSSTYTCEVTYKDDFYLIKEVSNDTQSSTTSSMTYYKVAFDGESLSGDNIRYTDGSSIGKIAIVKASALAIVEGTYTGTIKDTDGSSVGLTIVIQPASNGTYEALCSLSPTAASPDFPACKEHCLVTYNSGNLYLLANSWIKDPGGQSLIDFELTVNDKSLTGNMWIASETVGKVTLTQ